MQMSEDEKQLFEKLAAKHMADLYSNAIRLTSNAEQAEVLVQQTYADAFNHFDQLDKSNDFRIWLKSILMLNYASSPAYSKESTGKGKGKTIKA